MRYIFAVLLATMLFVSCDQQKYKISLAGEWQLLIDSLANPDQTDVLSLDYDRSIQLPSTLDDAGIGDPLSLQPTMTKEVMSTLKRKHSYIGPAFYSREVNIPKTWKNKQITLTMERIIWKSSVWIDGKAAGSQNSLTTPHYYDLSGLLTPGRHTLTICIDNRRQVDINSSDFAHAYTEQTQIRWNGILGEFSLTAHAGPSIASAKIYTDPAGNKASGTVTLSSRPPEESILKIQLTGPDEHIAATKVLNAAATEITFILVTEKQVIPWSELNPALYTIEISLLDKVGAVLDTHAEKIGFRIIEQKDGHMVLNNEKIFLRGTLECSIFPLTGHPPVNTEEWKDLMLKARNYGINHLRFHSWCPPAAAFKAADELGFYLQVELPNWCLTYGEDPVVVEFMEKEADRILREYGNHPSFVMLCMGNELMGNFDLINGLVKRLKESDNRRLYTATAFTFQQDHWGHHEPYDDFYITQWTDSGWVRGQGVFDQVPPNFRHNYDKAINHIKIPVVSHEIGQYSVYPNLAEIDKYTGVLTPLNFMAVRNDLESKGRLNMAPKYTEATGKFATILYKEEIERAYKTAGLSGFQLLDLHDFPGQGTALVGMLDAFWDSKGFTSGEEFRQFCSPVVPLLWYDKAVYSNNEVFIADVGVSNYYGNIQNAELTWSIKNGEGNQLWEGVISASTISHGTVSKLGSIEVPLTEVKIPDVLNIEVKLKDSPYKNTWKIWVYSPEQNPYPGNVLITTSFEKALNALEQGKKVLLTPPLDHIKGITGKFVPVFWSPVHFPNQPGTMGILCNPDHPVFNEFPTEFHSDWQWWDISKFSETLIIDSLKVESLVTVMDNFFKNRALTNLFEAKVGSGSLVFSSIDLVNHLDRRFASRQLKASILKYMNSEAFQPKYSISREELEGLQEVSEAAMDDVFSIYE